jgi:uncharacterized membrane protein YoaK (UPF0700 family)
VSAAGIAADIRAGKASPAFSRRVLAVATMFLGALIGAVLVLQVDTTAELAVATAVLAVVTVAAFSTTRHPGAWRVAA